MTRLSMTVNEKNDNSLPRIVRLDDLTANQIAAGEVIQRPASVIKELVENAVDAGAIQIDVVVKHAGRTLIQISDNGCGMSETDARLCFERHATSKIKSADDLFHLHTKGFRGEALASIAAIAHVELRTRLKDSEIGTCLVLEGSVCKEQSPCSCEAGTSFSVKNLFYNVPARRNFLKSDNVEFGHIHEEFLRIVLVHCNIGFKLYHNDKLEYNLPASNLKQRLVNVLGKSYDERLLPLEQETDIVRIHGFIGKPNVARKTRGEQYLFVNKRFIKHNYFHHSIAAAFEDVIPEKHFPSYFIYFEVNPELIDVNIHPTKTEVKFQEERLIYSFLHSTVKRSIGMFHLGGTIDYDNISPIDFSTISARNHPREPLISTNSDYNPFEKNKIKSSSASYSSENTIKGDESWKKIYESIQENIPVEHLEKQGIIMPIGQMEEPQEELKPSVFQTINRYIVARIKSGFVVIDPEAAFERILFERYLKNLSDTPNGSQKLLFAETLTFAPQNGDLVRDLLPEFNALGFDMEEFGRNTFILNGIPLGFEEQDIQQTIEQILESYKNNLISLKISKKNNIAHSFARSMGKKRSKLFSEEEMQSLLGELFSTSSPHLSPSGKKICITFNEMELRRMFL